MSLEELFIKYDRGKKGYLTRTEYEAFCYTLLINPIEKRDKYYISDIHDMMDNTAKDNLYPIFNYLSDGNNSITYDTLKKQALKFHFSEQDIKDMIEYAGGEIGYEQFVLMFK